MAGLNCPPFRPDSQHEQKGSSTGLGIDLCLTRIDTSNCWRWTTEQKLTIIEQGFLPGETVSSTASRHGIAPNLLYPWRRLLSEGGAAAVDSDEPGSAIRK